jgi:hypothetical protein
LVERGVVALLGILNQLKFNQHARLKSASRPPLTLEAYQQIVRLQGLGAESKGARAIPALTPQFLHARAEFPWDQ